MEIKPGMLMYVKISNEMGMVMGTRMSGNADFPGFIVEMKIPKQTHENGIQYALADFYEQELETAQERFDREYQEMFKLHKGLAGTSPSISEEVLDLIADDEETDLPN